MILDPRARRVLALAGAGRSVGAKLVRGAISDVYERLAGDLVEQTTARAAQLGLSPLEHEQACADRLRLLALTAAAQVLS